MTTTCCAACPSPRPIFVPGKWRNWAFQTVPQPGLDGRRGYQPRGRMLGGSSGINAMIYIRGHPGDYDDWAAQGAVGWGFSDVLPYFKQAEGNERFGGTRHGSEGPLNVADLVSPNPLNDTFLEACAELQLPHNRDFNGAVQEGVGLYQVTQKGGERWSAARAYLAPEVRKRPNLRILTDARALRVILSGRCATGVVCRHSGREETITAHRGSHSFGWCLPVAAAPAAVGHRSARGTRTPWARGAARPAGRRPQSAGPRRLHVDLCRQEPAPFRLHADRAGQTAARDPSLAA